MIQLNINTIVNNWPFLFFQKWCCFWPHFFCSYLVCLKHLVNQFKLVVRCTWFLCIVVIMQFRMASHCAVNINYFVFLQFKQMAFEVAVTITKHIIECWFQVHNLAYIFRSDLLYAMLVSPGKAFEIIWSGCIINFLFFTSLSFSFFELMIHFNCCWPWQTNDFKMRVERCNELVI